MRGRQHASPLLIEEGRATRLVRSPLEAPRRNESWLQELLFEHPAILPIDHLEPVFGPLIPIARELPTAVGPVDLVYINSRGYITLVETKLWRNPQARREVIAQIIDYAAALSAWSYDDLVQATKRARGSSSEPDPLLAIVRESEADFDEPRFCDAVIRNLQLGRFLLLVVGDGIQEGVEQMSDFLAGTPRLGFTLGLVEVAVFHPPEQESKLVIQPRIVARTREVVRAVVEVRSSVIGNEIAVSVPSEKSAAAVKKLTAEEWLVDVERRAGRDAREFAQWVIQEAPKHGLTTEWGTTEMIMYLPNPRGDSYGFNFLNWVGAGGEFKWLYLQCKAIGLPLEIATDYLDALASLIPGTRRVAAKTTQNLQTLAGTRPQVHLLALRRSEWFGAIDRASERIKAALSDA